MLLPDVLFDPHPVVVDVEKSEDIYDFFVSCGWVQREPRLISGTISM